MALGALVCCSPRSVDVDLVAAAVRTEKATEEATEEATKDKTARESVDVVPDDGDASDEDDASTPILRVST